MKDDSDKRGSPVEPRRDVGGGELQTCMMRGVPLKNLDLINFIGYTW